MIAQLSPRLHEDSAADMSLRDAREFEHTKRPFGRTDAMDLAERQPDVRCGDVVQHPTSSRCGKLSCAPDDGRDVGSRRAGIAPGHFRG